MNFNNKTEIDLSSNSSGIFFNGNSNDINLSSENNLNMGITSSVVQFDINNDNNINIDGNQNLKIRMKIMKIFLL